ncbi:MAG: hypothetical protein LBP53_08355 [Candidatus Peribacteria bacterium]|jgi:hypothetical protein|nr:hypothetical protein [Candidatus Peribacteria bacterium]
MESIFIVVYDTHQKKSLLFFDFWEGLEYNGVRKIFYLDKFVEMATKEEIIRRADTISQNLESFAQLKNIIIETNLKLASVVNDIIPVDTEVMAALGTIRNKLVS